MTMTGQGRPLAAALWAALCAALCLPLAGCGFSPLYADNQTGGSLRDIRVEVDEHSRSNFLLQERLNDAFGRANGPGSWVLTFTSVKRRYPQGVRVNNVATRYGLSLTVSFALKDAASGKTALADTVTGQVSYASSDQPYAGVAAEQDGEARAAAAAADLIRLRLSQYFAARPAP
jgi:LPS-assembly lipoprotein